MAEDNTKKNTLILAMKSSPRKSEKITSYKKILDSQSPVMRQDIIFHEYSL